MMKDTMTYVAIVTACIFVFLGTNASSAERLISVNEDLTIAPLSHAMEYLVDADNRLEDIGSVTDPAIVWQPVTGESVNFGYVSHPYWFRFTLDNRRHSSESIYFELDYPMLDLVSFYAPDRHAAGGFRKIVTGDTVPFSQRDIIDRNFVFALNEGPGVHTYYFRINTGSSLNFMPKLISHRSFLERLHVELPYLWMFAGILVIIILYNLFFLFSLRDRTYLYYILFLISYGTLMLCLNGLAFQYLWPNAIWWANKVVPLSMCFSSALIGQFSRSYLDTRHKHRIIDIVLIVLAIVPGLAWVIPTLLFPYPIAIRVATMLTFLSSAVPFFAFIGAKAYRSRDTFFGLIGCFGLIFGSITFILKTVGLIPANLFTQNCIMLGLVVLAVFFCLGLSDRVSTMRTSLVSLNCDLEANEKSARERSQFLEEVMASVRTLSGSFAALNASLVDISRKLSNLAEEQASSSEELSATFEEITSANEQIHDSTLSQKREGGQTRNMVTELNRKQQDVMHAGSTVIESIGAITQSASGTKENLKVMSETMEVISHGGAEINRFLELINDISDRINLLSLNAAIEAARAGEHGRGFAVVAEEIGKLAQATADNSKQIGGQITAIINDISRGAATVTETRSSAEHMLSLVEKIRGGIDTVGDLMQNQTTTLQQVIMQAEQTDILSQNIVDATMEQNRSLQQTMSTVERLSQMAQEIAQMNMTIHQSCTELNGHCDQLLVLASEDHGGPGLPAA